MQNRQQATGKRELQKGADIAERLLTFAVGVLDIASKLPRSFAGRQVAQQLVRAATSAGANYEEARAAESRSDFVHKLRIAGKEARETVYWLRLVDRARLAPAEHLATEAVELSAILIASARTAQST